MTKSAKPLTSSSTGYRPAQPPQRGFPPPSPPRRPVTQRFRWPTMGWQGAITSRYGDYRPYRQAAPLHEGLDIAPVGAERSRSDLLVAPIAAGLVVKTGYDPQGYGIYAVIRHPDGTESLYGHMSRLAVKTGEPVTPDRPIGVVGSTGFSTGPHLHLSIRQPGRAAPANLVWEGAIDPLELIAPPGVAPQPQQGGIPTPTPTPPPPPPTPVPTPQQRALVGTVTPAPVTRPTVTPTPVPTPQQRALVGTVTPAPVTRPAVTPTPPAAGARPPAPQQTPQPPAGYQQPARQTEQAVNPLTGVFGLLFPQAPDVDDIAVNVIGGVILLIILFMLVWQIISSISGAPDIKDLARLASIAKG